MSMPFHATIGSVQTRRLRGFTLVELLVVISIVSMLVALLLPTLSEARASAQQVQCAANLRGLTSATLIYAADHNGYLPYAHGKGNGAMMGQWSVPTPGGPMNYHTSTTYQYHRPTQNLLENYAGGIVNSSSSRSHMVRCPGNTDMAALGHQPSIVSSFELNRLNSTYLYMGQSGFLNPDMNHTIPDTDRRVYVLPFRINVMEQLVDRYKYSHVMFLDRVDFRRRGDTATNLNTHWDSNHGELQGIRGGNIAYHDASVRWQNYQYTPGSMLAATNDWATIHTDAWDAFRVPRNGIIWYRVSTNSRFLWGTNSKGVSGGPHLNPLTDATFSY